MRAPRSSAFHCPGASFAIRVAARRCGLPLGSNEVLRKSPSVDASPSAEIAMSWSMSVGSCAQPRTRPGRVAGRHHRIAAAPWPRSHATAARSAAGVGSSRPRPACHARRARTPPPSRPPRRHSPAGRRRSCRNPTPARVSHRPGRPCAPRRASGTKEPADGEPSVPEEQAARIATSARPSPRPSQRRIRTPTRRRRSGRRRTRTGPRSRR